MERELGLAGALETASSHHLSRSVLIEEGSFLFPLSFL